MTSSTILVAGAVTHDYLLYRHPVNSLSIASRSTGQEAQIVMRQNGADLVAQLLIAASSNGNYQVHSPGHQQINGISRADINARPSTITELSCHLTDSPAGVKYSIIESHSLAQAQHWQVPSETHPINDPSQSILVLSGSGASDDEIQPVLDLLSRVKPSQLIYYMTSPLGCGRLWDVLRSGPDASQGTPGPDGLFVIIDAEELRSQGINLSQGLSWEATSEDFVRNLGSNGRLDTLVTCPNLLVRFGTEGVIHHRGRDAGDPRLYFNSKHSEGSATGRDAASMIGLGSAFVAGFAHGLSTTDADRGIQLGLSAAHRMAVLGFTPNAQDQSPEYPIAQIMEVVANKKTYPSASIPSSKISTGDRWLLLDSLTGDPTEVARQILTHGPEKALGRCPTRQYGDLIVTERAEIESLGAISNIIDERLQSAQASSTCLGIFGPAGSGKTFTAESIAKHIAGKTSTTIMTHDSRFLKEESFAAVCHDIRDISATGSLPLVIFKNFESVLTGQEGLLDTFSTLMSEGTFPDRGAVRQLGHSVMFFLVNQDAIADPETPFSPVADMTLKRRSTFASMSETRSSRLEDSPLVDLLHGIIKVNGPNFNSSGDKTFAIRRALMLRHLIKDKHPHLEVNGVINIDDAVLHALLLTPTFKHGLGSLQKIISASRLSSRTKFDVSALPPEEQIQLHVDGKIFMSFLRAPKLPPQLREILAQGLFEAYKTQRLHMVKSEDERRQLVREPSFRDWDELPGELKESTRAQADDIPRKLRAVGCFMLNDGQGEPRGDPLEAIPAFGQQELLMLSEMEHERYNAERLQRQWRMGPRNSKQRTTPFLVPWRDLTQEWKDVDTVMVECVPRLLERAGWRIYRMKD